MSVNPSEVKTPAGGEVNLGDLLRVIRQEPPSHPRKREQGFR